MYLNDLLIAPTGSHFPPMLLEFYPCLLSSLWLIMILSSVARSLLDPVLLLPAFSNCLVSSCKKCTTVWSCSSLLSVLTSLYSVHSAICQGCVHLFMLCSWNRSQLMHSIICCSIWMLTNDGLAYPLITWVRKGSFSFSPPYLWILFLSMILPLLIINPV